MSVIDYRRFDSLADDSDEEPAEPDMDAKMQELLSAGPGNQLVRPAIQSRSGPSARSGSGRIKVHPADTSAPAWVHSDPETWVAPACPYTGRKHTWGVCAADAMAENPDDPMAGMSGAFRVMNTQSLYGMFGGGDYPETPEKQFVHRLMERKKKQLAAQLPAVEHLFKQDMLLEIELDHVKPRIWRQFRVSGAISLRTLQDKVVAPLMGWVRNYHGYQFSDGKDASVWGPEDSNAIDMMHMHMNGFDFLDDRKTRLAEVLQVAGDTMGYMYDMGDHWVHDIRLITLFPPEESNGRCQVLDGAMACPPEDSNGLKGMGLQSYKEFLDEVLPATGTKKWRKMCAEASGGLNYKGRNFDPEEFSVEACQKAINSAFRSRASVSSGSKLFNVPLRPGGLDMSQPKAEKGTRNTTREGTEGLSYMQETVSTRRDKSDNTLCAECGSPHNLKLCSGCKRIRFCGQGCQKIAWKAWHRQQCLAVQAARAKEGHRSNIGNQ